MNQYEQMILDAYREANQHLSTVDFANPKPEAVKAWLDGLVRSKFNLMKIGELARQAA